MSKKKNTACSEDVKYLLSIVETLGFFTDDEDLPPMCVTMYFTGSREGDLALNKEIKRLRKKYGVR